VNRLQLGSIQIEYTKWQTSRTPEYKTAGSAGADLWPSIDTTIEKFKTKIVPTGIAFEIPEGHHGQIHARSSARLAGLEITGIIDEDYRGPIGLIVRNTNAHTIDIRADGTAIAQIVIVPNIQVTFKEVKFLKQTLRKG